MPGLDTRRLVLLQATCSSPGEMDTYSLGTGYFVTANLVLTARHTVRDQRVNKLEVRTEADGRWRAAHAEPIWENQQLDAALIHVDDGLGDVPDVQWVDRSFDDSQAFRSSGYPSAAKVSQPQTVLYKQAELNGKLNYLGGGGQGTRELELQVEAPPGADDWRGISGAPVFVGDHLAGFIKEAPTSFQGNRLAGTSSTSLLQDASFRVAIAPRWLEPDPDRVLVVVSERGRISLGDRVDTSLTRHRGTLESLGGIRIAPSSTKVKITDALSSPGRFLQFVRALCSAPVAIFDVTGSEPEPAVMLALGIRSVVRRGVTITSTAEKLAEKDLSALPFSIKETKLIHHGGGFADHEDRRHPFNMIATAIIDGWRELRLQPGSYLDLPAYDAVRGPAPILSTVANGRRALKRILVLCPFRASYEAQFQRIAEAIASKYPDPDRAPKRMLDIASPRLVGQALYESIRWSTTCIVDFMHWRANVFFELGVRLACSNVDPICLVERGARDQVQTGNELAQKRLLMTLFDPAVYAAESEIDAVHPALDRHEAINAGRPSPTAVGVLPYGAIYGVCEQAFDWKQERIVEEPHEVLRRGIEATFGNDPQAHGQQAVLFAANPEYRRELKHSIQERWIAAWYYLANRYPRDRWRTDAGLRKTLKKLAEDVLQHGRLRDSPDPALKSLCAQIDDIVDELDELAKANP